MQQSDVYKCPVCQGELTFTPAVGKWQCYYCDNIFTIEDLQQRGAAPVTFDKISDKPQHRELEEEERDLVVADDGTEATDLVAYKCGHCSAELITSRSTASTVCVYCGYPVTMSEQFSGEFKPRGVVPFKFEQDKATEEFLKFMKKPLTPKKFFSDVKVKKVQGVYVPFWLYSGEAQGVYHAEGRIENPWKGNSRKIDIYDCWRQYHLNYRNIPVDASKRIDNDAMDSIEPFDMNELAPFNPAYLAGYLAERYDESAKDCFDRALPRIQQTGKDFSYEELKKQYNTVYEQDGADCDVKNKSADYVMLPTWLLYTTYNNKDYLFAMNGQTGKFIGNLPIDKGKFALFTTLFTIGGALLGFLLGGL